MSLYQRLQSFVRADPDVVYDAVRVTVWGRWFLLLVIILMTFYRPGHQFPHDIEHLAPPLLTHWALHLVIVLVPLVGNGLAHHRLRTNRPVTWRWVLGLSAMDVALTTAYVAGHQGFQAFAFLGYYPALCAFAMVFSSLRFVLAWVTATAVAYTVVCVMAGPGLDLANGDDKELLGRLAVMYLTAACVGVIVRMERARRQAARERERQAQQERIDLSQAIHDTSAQTAYMIRLGIEGAIRQAGDSNPRLVERLAATAELSKSAMWELRRPIDMGRLFEGQELGQVLRSHAATFAAITAVPTELVQSGSEPPLAPEAQARLLTIAHNALANAFLHAQAERVEVRLDFGADAVRLSVSDDGVGLPDDYAERGRGFGGMERDAQRLGGTLIVETGGPAGGTTVTCVAPYETVRTGGCDDSD